MKGARNRCVYVFQSYSDSSSREESRQISKTQGLINKGMIYEQIIKTFSYIGQSSRGDF